MNNVILFGLTALLVLLLCACVIIWQIGRNKAAALKRLIHSLNGENKALLANQGTLEEQCAQIAPLEQELDSFRKKRDEMRAEIDKLTANLSQDADNTRNLKTENETLQGKIDGLTQELAAETEKNKQLAAVSDELIETKALLEELRAGADQGKNEIAELMTKIQAEQIKSEEQTVKLNSIKELFS